VVDRAAAQALTLFVAGWLLAASCMIRPIIRVFQAMEQSGSALPW